MNNPTLSGLVILALTLANSAYCASSVAQHRGERLAAVSGSGLGKPKSARPQEGKGAQALLELEPRPSPELRLPTEFEIPELKPLAQAWADLPQKVWFESTVRNEIPIKVAIREVGASSNGLVCVCLHGVLGQGDNWKYVAGAINGEYEMWLVDLPGCGQSEAPAPALVGRGGYGPEALADRALQAIQARLQRRPDVSRIILAGHSLGGLVSLRMFMDDELRQRHAQVLEKVEGMVLFAPSDVAVTKATDTWLTFLGINGFKAAVGGALQIVQSKVAGSVRQSFCAPALASRELAVEGVDLIENGSSRNANQAILRDAIPWVVFGKTPDWQTIYRLEASYANVKVPCLIVWGKCDPTLPEATGYKIKDQLPDARLVVLPETMHLLPLERPQVCANLLKEFHQQVTRGGLAAAHTVRTLQPESYARKLAQAQ